jgi:transposase
MALENLSIEGLAKTKLAKSMLDAAFGETVRQCSTPWDTWSR